MNKRSCWRLLILLLFVTLVTGCAVTHKFGPYFGRVVDAETGKPIEGAVVFMKCNTSTANIGGSNSHYADAIEVLTNENGEFHVELRVTTLRIGHVWDRYQYIMVFKPSYGVFPGHRDSKVDILIRDTSHLFPKNTYVTISLPKLQTIEERRNNLGNLFVSSRVPHEKWSKLFQLKSIERAQIGLK